MIYLVHHAEAVEPEVDPQRPLTVAGRAHADRVALAAAERGVKPAVIWHSGKLRARQTAESFWRACHPLAEFAAIGGLQPSDSPGRICDLVNGEERDVMLVGHMPSLPRIFRSLIGADENAPHDFPQHGLVALEQGKAGWVESFRISGGY
jgi:phosphohistidine phosphatase